MRQGLNQQNLATVRRLCSAWPILTRMQFAEIMTPDCLYINVPWPHRACYGPDEAADFLKFLQANYTIEIEILTGVANDEVVMCERLERFRSPENGTILLELPVTGVFKLRDSQIAEWHDYFDSVQARAITNPAR